MKYLNLYVAGTKGIYSYSDPQGEYRVGDLVVVDFRNKERKGIVVEELRDFIPEFQIKNIKRKLTGISSYSEEYVKLLLWVKNYYLAGYSSVFSFLNGEKVKISYKREYSFNYDIELAEDSDEELRKYFKKREWVLQRSVEKKFSSEQVEKFLEKKLLIFREIPLEKKITTEKKIYEKDYDGSEIDLNPTQRKVAESIISSEERYHLIHGVTGSGKTEIYIELIKKAYSQGKNSIFLVPEISLTPQFIKRFEKEFGTNLAVLHSKLSQREIANQWEIIARGEKRVVLGVRSAIFAPLENIGYIIIDEEHELTYKQNDHLRYNAKMVALKRGEIQGAKVILGSATPSVESYFFAEKGIFKLYSLKERYNDAKLPDIVVADMKLSENELFSNELLENIKDSLIRNEQVIILLNRKGYSTYIQCSDCGHVEECPHCSIKYSFYQSENRLKCNYCGVSKKFTGTCSKCGSHNISHSGKGVEKIVEELKKIFPVNILRVDSEVSKEKEFHERMYEDFSKGKYSILVGTQMITKGLHFPNVTTVGVISADMSLSFPDFRAGERTFQLLTQVSGRAGRGEKPGKVVIQTYQPENVIFKDIINSDYENFYKREIEDRRILFYPPFSKLINIGISSPDKVKLEEYGKKIYNSIVEPSVEIYGPMKSLVYKVKDRYRENIFIKGRKKEIDLYKRILDERIEEYREDKNLRVTVDIDPTDLI